MTTRSEKLAEARRLLDEAARTRHTDIGLAATIDALRLTLDLIEISETTMRCAKCGEKDGSTTRTNDICSAEPAPAPTMFTAQNFRDLLPDDGSIAPNFSAMAMMLAGRSHEHCLEWLAANWPKPAPAVVRDEAWWWRQAERLGNVIEQWRFEDDPKKTWRSEVAGWLRATFGQDSAPAPAVVRTDEAQVLLDNLLTFIAHNVSHRGECESVQAEVSRVFAAPAPAVVRDEAWWNSDVAWKFCTRVVSAAHSSTNDQEFAGHAGAIDDVRVLLRATFGNDPAPAPAPALVTPTVVRDEAWWLASARSLVLACRLDLGTEKRKRIAWWLRVSFGQDPAPAPAFDVRESAEYKALASDSEATQDKARCYGRTLLELGKCIGWDRSIDQQSDGEPLWEAMARALRRRLSAPAFDVEALVRRCEHECDEGGFVRVERVRAVAREMLKGGAK